ncbi:hypothetical protein H7992_21790 [Sporosarcina sp. resist]|uniref:hypothetical protein n=1 Tax=Sporosarcina sp. resist TaxID=2762563 RepID=UPI00164EBE38|nr:hypothetical protein [Sporosarcina sp. resist]QNK87767.1 hypothetical protein H7992_21790 [Sporosarcina sp. resist]
MFKISFKGKCHFFLAEELVIKQFKDEKIKRAIISAKSGTFKIDFTADYSDDGRALYVTQKILEDYTKIFLMETGYEIHDIQWKSIIPIDTEEKNEKVLRFRDNIDLRSELTIIRPLENEQDLKGKLENHSTDDYTSYVNLFINVSRINDEIGKFVLFYSILSALHGRQISVDDFIKSIEPNVVLRETSRENADFDETIYSFLRNQIGHTSEETDTVTLNREIKENIEGLRKIVKEAVIL